jgi:hypothetical protein
MRIKIILLATLLTVPSLISFATDYYKATTVLNVRNGEGTEYSVSFTLQEGDEVEVLSKNNSWYRIKYFGKTGYAHSKYLQYSRTISDTTLDTPKQRMSYFPIVVCVSLALFIVFFLFKKTRDIKLLETVTELNRGIKTERDLVLKLLKFSMPAHVIFHDLYVEKQKGDFSQIDLVAVTGVGVIVFEVKDYSGWLFGSGNQSQWTQVLAYGKQKYRFYNPIMQNNKHVAELRKQLIQFGNVPFYSIVVFYGNCVLKEINFVPNGTFLVKSERVLDVVEIILKENEPVHYANEGEVFGILKEAVINGGIIENQIRHKENIKDMLGKHRIFD